MGILGGEMNLTTYLQCQKGIFHDVFTFVYLHLFSKLCVLILLHKLKLHRVAFVLEQTHTLSPLLTFGISLWLLRGGICGVIYILYLQSFYPWWHFYLLCVSVIYTLCWFAKSVL